MKKKPKERPSKVIVSKATVTARGVGSKTNRIVLGPPKLKERIKAGLLKFEITRDVVPPWPTRVFVLEVGNSGDNCGRIRAVFASLNRMTAWVREQFPKHVRITEGYAASDRFWANDKIREWLRYRHDVTGVHLIK